MPHMGHCPLCKCTSTCSYQPAVGTNRAHLLLQRHFQGALALQVQDLWVIALSLVI